MRKSLGSSICIIFVGLFLMGFQKQPYKIIDKNIEGRTYHLAIPSSFCEYKPLSNEIFQFVKCYEIEMEKQWELSSFSERILVAVEKGDIRTQTITDSELARAQKDSYDKASAEYKDNYFANDRYPINNKSKAKIVNDRYIFSRFGEAQNGEIYNTFESNVFLNKRYFMFNWSQFLTKNEPRLNDKKFDSFIGENVKANETNSLNYNLNGQNISISKPKFGNFMNYTDLKEFNVAGFHAIFISLNNGYQNENIKIFKTILIPSSVTLEKGFSEVEGSAAISPTLVNYGGKNFIKMAKDGSMIYVAYLDLGGVNTGIVSLETRTTDDNKNLKYLSKYLDQLREENLGRQI